ncbi:hypothetical protein FRC00_008285 [Tulasnella sp. 408]|nr:hypothetical protein FRC00_008285 [Tulasnella sp. 408]
MSSYYLPNFCNPPVSITWPRQPPIRELGFNTNDVSMIWIGETGLSIASFSNSISVNWLTPINDLTTTINPLPPVLCDDSSDHPVILLIYLIHSSRTPQPKISAKAEINDSGNQDMINRQSTQHGVGDIKKGPALWKLIHAVLNASTKRGLTTKEVVGALRHHFPEQHFTQSTVCYNLTQSEDFKQVYPEGKTPGRWFLTGEVRGINRTNPVRAMELQLPIDIFSAGDEDYNDDESDDDNDNDDLATPPNTPPAAGLPYPSKTEEIEAQYSPDPNFSSPTWSSSLPTRATIMLATVGGVHYPQPTSELMTPHAQETTGTTYFNSYTGELAGLGALSGLLGPSLPSHSTSKVPLSPNTSFPNLTRGNGFLQGPSNVEFYSSPIPYQRDLGLNTSNPIGSFGGGTISTFFRQDDSAQEHTLGEFPGGWVTEDNTPRSAGSSQRAQFPGVPDLHEAEHGVQWGL